MASSNVAEDGRPVIAVRGTITSWTRPWPSSMTAWIICSSSASRMPCSPPRSTMSLSSSALICASCETSAPSALVIRRVIPVRRPTSGPRIRPSQSMGRPRTRANRSGWPSASVFGTSSPNTIVNSARRTVTSTSDTGDAVDPMIGVSTLSRRVTRLTAAYAEAKKPRNVSPSWLTARNRPGSSSRRRTRRALRLPSSTS